MIDLVQRGPFSIRQRAMVFFSLLKSLEDHPLAALEALCSSVGGVPRVDVCVIELALLGSDGLGEGL